MRNGHFITFEGPEGAGKTTIIREVVKQLAQEGYQQVIITREPGGSKIAELIRNIILDVKNVEMDERTEALLFAAARRQHLVEVVLPALKEGKIVICDRFIDSSLAYQGLAREIGVELIWQINEFAIEGHLPDLTLLIDVPAEVGIQRIHASRKQEKFDRLDQEKITFHHRVRQAFLLLEDQHQRIQKVDGTLSIAEVTQMCMEKIRQEIANKEE